MGSSAVAVDQTLPPHATSAGAARRLVGIALQEAELPHLDDTCRTAISELVTNALVHAGTELRVTVRIEHDYVRVEVHDGSTHLPARREYSSSSGTGRGLGIVADLVDEWGAHRVPAGKVVWFVVRARPDSGDGHSALPASDEPVLDADDLDAVAIELRQFPLLMHAAWQEHCSALLREHLLVSVGAGDEVAAFERHARASDAMNLLYEQVPAPELADDPDAIMITATEPHVTLGSVVVTIPRASVSHFSTLNTMVVEAITSADAGRLLVPPTQPEIKELRTWLCAEVLSQAAAKPPRPWRYSHTGVRGPAGGFVPPGWDPGEVTRSPRALIATSQDSVIVAVSASAAGLLGYQPDDLVGRRVLTIIPARYHQAHIAGTTLHMANGRAPLLDKRVDVPVTRADGTEVTLRLLVRVQHLPGGARVFVAELTPAEPPPPRD